MADCQIQCITRSTLNGGHEHITHVGNGVVPWYLPVETVIASIDQGTNTFYVQDAYGRRANVGVVRPAHGRPYLRTYADGVWTDNLLSLPACR